MIELENHGYDQTVGNPLMPYLNGLIAKGGLATEFYANTHPSIGNYFLQTTGQIITNDDTFVQTVDVDNIVREMIAAGRTWRSYAESIPQQGYTGPDKFPYLKRHNPFSYFWDVVNDAKQRENLATLGQLRGDLKKGLPDFTYILPNAINDAHSCPPAKPKCTDDELQAAADRFLAKTLPNVLDSPDFQKDGLLIIVYDEALLSDTTHGGGHIAMILYGPKVKAGYHSTKLYQQQSVERLICDSLGLAKCPGAGADAPEMNEFLK
jgi:acid phosphatase